MVYHVLMLHLNHKFNLSPFLCTLALLDPGEVDAQGAPGTENSREVPCLTGKIYKPIFLALSYSCPRSGPKDNDNQTNSEQVWLLKQGISSMS